MIPLRKLSDRPSSVVSILNAQFLGLIDRQPHGSYDTRSITRDHPPFQTTCPKQRPPLLVFALPSCKHNTSVEAFVLLSPDSLVNPVERVSEDCYSPFPCRKPVKTYRSKFTSLRRSSPRSGRESGCGRECGRSSSTSASATSSERYPAQTAELVRSAIPPLPPLVIAHITTSSACAYSQGG